MDRLRAWAFTTMGCGGGLVALAWFVKRSGIPGPFAISGGTWFIVLVAGCALAIGAALVALAIPERDGMDVLLRRIAQVLGAPSLAAGFVALALLAIFTSYVLFPWISFPPDSIPRRVITTPTAYAVVACAGLLAALPGLVALLVTPRGGSKERRFKELVPLAGGAALAVAPWLTFSLIE